MTRNRIDVHVHYFGGTIDRLLYESNLRLSGNFKMPVRWTVNEALAMMDRHEVAAQILSVPFATQVSESLGSSVRLSRTINEECAELIARYPGRFGALTSIPLNNPEVALAEIAYGLDDLGLDGVILSTNAVGHYFGQPLFEPILAELNRRRVPVLVHPIDSPDVSRITFGRPGSVLEYPVDTARTITNAIYTGVFKRYPDLKLILAHCGGALPTLAWRIAKHTAMGRSAEDPTKGRGPDDADIDADHVTQVLRGLYYDTALAGGRHSLLPALQVTSADHILFGTDWPPAAEAVIAENNANLIEFGFSDSQLTGIDRGNAVRLFPRFA